MSRVPWLRIAGAALPPLLVSLWMTMPSFRPESVELRGTVVRAEVCLAGHLCTDVVGIGDQRLACKADLLGLPYGCREKLMQPGEAVVRYARYPSLLGLVGWAPTSGVLLRLERGGDVVVSHSVVGTVWRALYGGWKFHAIYWPLAALAIWWRPNSWLARRAMWRGKRNDRP